MIAAPSASSPAALRLTSLCLVFCGGLSLAISHQVLSISGRFGPTMVVAVTAVGVAGLVVAVATFALPVRVRFFGLGLAVATLVVLPAALLIAFSWRTGTPLDVQDGMMQTQIVASRLLQGHDPYGTDFTRTELMRWFQYSDGAATPRHYVYFPLVVLVAVPAVALEHILGLPADLRPFLLSLGVAAVLLILHLPIPWRTRYVLSTLLLLDPFFGWLEGRNDVLWILPILAGVALTLEGRWRWAAWSIGLAAAFKVFAFPFALFMGAALLVRWRRNLLSTTSLWQALVGLIAPLSITALPFVTWDPVAFWNDTAGWVLAGGFPIYGFGLGRALLLSHLLPSPFAPFPFGLVQALLGFPVIVLGLRRVGRSPTIGPIVASAGVLLAILVLCGRFSNDNYLASVLFLLTLGVAVGRHDRETTGAAEARAA